MAVGAIAIAIMSGTIAYDSGLGRGAELMRERLNSLEEDYILLREDVDRYRVEAVKASDGARAANELKLQLVAKRLEHTAKHSERMRDIAEELAAKD